MSMAALMPRREKVLRPCHPGPASGRAGGLEHRVARAGSPLMAVEAGCFPPGAFPEP